MTWSVANYNTNPDLNNSINGVDIAELCAAGGFNNALRQIMADIAVWVSTGLATLGGLPAIYRDLPIVPKTGAFTFADSERSCAINYVGGAAAATINPEATTPISYGAAYLIRNGGSGPLTITPGAGVTLDKNGGIASGSAVLAIGGVASLVKWGTDFFTINGSGLT